MCRQIRVFGFHLLSLDIRDNAQAIHATIVAKKSGSLTPETREVLKTIQSLREIQDEVDPKSATAYVLSMTHSKENVLELFSLIQKAGLTGRVDIVPLFETIDDLRRCDEVDV